MIECQFENGHKTTNLRHITAEAILIRDSEVLLVRRAPHLNEGGKWALIGGFFDRDETLPEAVAREIKEEGGYEVTQLILLTIRHNPDRPGDDRQCVSFVYIAIAGGQTGTSDDEVTEMKWFNVDNLPLREEVAFDHYDDLVLYKQYLDENLSLPILDSMNAL